MEGIGKHFSLFSHNLLIHYRPLYYDPHNDEFDRDSDEDFIVDLHSGEGVRRRLRRTNDNPPAHENHNANEENKNSERRQRYERNRRIRDRNRRRGEEDDDESEDMEDYAIQDLIEDEESEEDSIMKLEGSSRITRNRNNDNSSHDPPFPDEISEERKDEAESISSTKSTPLVIPSSSRIISEDDKDEDLIKPTGFYVSQNNEENYQLENSEMKDGYQIDIEEAIKMKDEDKSALDCGLCKKKRGEFSLIGPFKYFLNNKATDEMVYWFHRECLERNDIVKQISKYEFDNIQEWVNEWILNESNECKRCWIKGASVSWTVCKEFYHGFKWSFLRMAQDYEGNLVWIKWLNDHLRQQLSDSFLDEIDNKLMEKDFYKKKNRKMFYDQLHGIYTPQKDDEIYFIFQAYEEIVGYYIYHFITLEEERNKPINDFKDRFMSLRLPDKNILTHKPLKCKIIDLKYMLPSPTSVEMNRKLNTGNTLFPIQTEIELEVLEPEEVMGLKFSIIYFNTNLLEDSISMNYIIPSDQFIQTIADEELENIHGTSLKSFDLNDTPKEMLEVSDFEPEVYEDCNYKCIFYKQKVFNSNPDGIRLRTNVLGRSKFLNIGRLSIWDVKNGSNGSTPLKETQVKFYTENRGFNPENYPTAFNEAERLKLVETLDAFIKNNNYTSSFVDNVTEDIASDYLNIIAVEMNLYTIRDNLEFDRYRSKEMLLKDLELIDINWIEFNGADSALAKDSKKLYDKLSEIFRKAFTYKLRNVSY